MPAVPDHSAELALLWCVMSNVVVFGSAWRFTGRRVTASRSQAVFDAALLGYAVQYVAVGLPGMFGLLRPGVVAAVALACSAGLTWAAGRRRRLAWGGRSPAVVVAAAAFATAVVVGYAWNQAALPLVSTDALTYHFPAAVQWLQQRRIGLFPTWFFNPANGYSPLAGSTFIAWLILPLGTDVLARFVQVPALLCVGLGVYRLGRQLSAQPAVAAAGGVAAVLCRPLFTAALMGKDDLFVAFTFVAAVVALAPDRSAEPFGPVRLGLAVGLLLATKYTAVLAVPLLLLAADGPRWRAGRWVAAAAVAALLAGPWYVRNWIATGNPVFPLAVPHSFRGLFSAARSEAFRSPIDRRYGLPAAVFAVAVVGVLGTDWRRLRSDPLLRAGVVGPVVGVGLFFWRSPFPEVRFLFPALVLLLAVPVASVARLPARWRWVVAALPAAAVATVSVSGGWELFGWLVPIAAVVAMVAAGLDTAAHGVWRALAVAVPVGVILLMAYVRWSAFCRDYAGQWTDGDTIWALQYPGDAPLWRTVNRLTPADATVAYADLYLVYPLQGPGLRRRIAYAPTRRGVRSPADLPWLGDHLSGERLVGAADVATVADPDPLVWRENLRRLGAEFLVIGHAVPAQRAIEATWAMADPHQFRPLYAGPAGWVFAVHLAD